MKPLVAIAALLMAAATLWWVTFRHQHREYVMRYVEPEDGAQPFDPWPTTFHPEGAWIGGRYYPQDDAGAMTLSWGKDGVFTASSPARWSSPPVTTRSDGW